MAGIDASAVLEVGGERCRIQRLDALEAQFGVSRLPYSLKVLLENLLRHNDGVNVAFVDGHSKWFNRQTIEGDAGQ